MAAEEQGQSRGKPHPLVAGVLAILVVLCVESVIVGSLASAVLTGGIPFFWWLRRILKRSSRLPFL